MTNRKFFRFRKFILQLFNSSSPITMSPIKTFVFLDLETTGLPHLEHNTTKITELCAVSVLADHIELGCFPRVHNKLNLCLNPGKMISPQSTEITGLSNDLLEHHPYFSSNIVEMMNKWLDMNPKPICFVAHNGNRFDYPILRAEVNKTGGSLLQDVVCIDSLIAFKAIDRTQVNEAPGEPFDFDDGFDEILNQAVDEFEKKKLTPEEIQKINETTPEKLKISGMEVRDGRSAKKLNFKTFQSYKLGDIYSRLTNKSPLGAHEAEGDVVMLITCAAVYGEKFVQFANHNAIRFDEIPAMRPGRRVGVL